MLETPGGIQKVPNEVLTRVFEHASWENTTSAWNPTLNSILRVCRSWYILGIPILYRVLRFSFWETAPYGRSERIGLLQTLSRYPELYDHVRGIWISLGQPPDDFLRELLERIAPQLRQLHVRGYISELPQEDILTLITSMDLEELSLTSRWCVPVLDRMLRQGLILPLRTLILKSSVRSEGNFKLENAYCLSALDNVSCLELKLISWSFEAIRDILKLTRRVQSLKLTITWAWSSPDETSRVNETSYVQNLLNLRKDTLEEIEIAEFQDDIRGSMLNLSGFIFLRSIQLHHRNVFTTPAHIAAAKLSSPHLHRLSIDMRQESEFCLPISAHIDWIIAFVRFQREESNTNSLQEFQLLYPGQIESMVDLLRGVYRSGPSLHEQLETAAALLASLGIRLSLPILHTGGKYSDLDFEEHGIDIGRMLSGLID